MTTTGVKPKMISNIALVMLLFLFASSATATIPYTLRPDTIIIDGEIIEMEKKEVKTNVDSLQKVENLDQKEPPAQWRFFVGMDYQVGTHISKIETPPSNFIELSSFLNTNSSISLGMGLAGNFGLDLSDYLAVYSRFYWGNYRVRSVSLDESSLSAEADRSAFVNNNGTLYERYVLFIDPGFEERFEEVPTNENAMGIRVAGVGINGRFYTNGKNKKSTPFIDLGALWRSQKIRSDEQIYVVAENGKWSKTSVAAQQGSGSTWFAQLGIGYMMELSANRHLEFSLVYEGLPRDLYSLSTVRRSTSFVGVRLGYAFSFMK